MNLLQQFVNFLINQKARPSLLTVKNYKADIGQFVNWFEKEFNSSFNPSIITLQILQQYKRKRNLSENSTKRHTSSLRKFFKFLKLEKIISQNPLEKKIVSAEALAKEDPWMLRNFKSFLYEYKKSNLTIKNYINDIQSFFTWLGKVALVEYIWNVTDRNLLNKINPSIITDYKQRLIEAKFSPRTINRKLSSLRSYINWAKSQGLIPSDHAELLPANTPYKQAQANTSTFQTEYIENKSPYLVQSNRTNYSLFPPIRLMQKSFRGVNSLFDNLFILPLAHALEATQYLFWKIQGKKIFKKYTISKSSIPGEGFRSIPVRYDEVSNVKKEFYAPLDISTHYLPIYKRVLHYIRYVRPNWYKQYHSYSFTHYLHFAILMTLSCIVAFGIYDMLFANTQKKDNILGAVTTASSRILSFHGKLTDSQNNPITTATDIIFSIYDDEKASEAASLWQETNSVKPNLDGIFSAFLGRNIPIPDALFSQNPELFLGIRVGNSPQLLPRQKLATVSLASNSETLQGLKPITNTTDVNNVVLALDSSGNLNIAGSKAHTFQAIGGNFVLSGKILSLTTVPGSNGDIEIAPDGTGKIDLSKPIHNTTNNNNLSLASGSVEFDDTLAILATSSAQPALYINQNSTGALINAGTNEITKFAVGNEGTGIFSGDLGINGGNLTSTAPTFNLLNTDVTTLNIGGEATSLFLGTASGSAVIQSNLVLGSSDANAITFSGRVARDSSLVPITIDGTNSLGSSSLPWDNAYINNIYAVKLDIQTSQAATAAAQIFNTYDGTDADGLIIKLGNTSTSAVNAANHFLSFETSGIGIVGSVQGNGGTGVTYATSGIADFAEYFKKDKNQQIPYGSVVCLQDNGLAAPCDPSAGSGQGTIIGVASEHPAFLGGENLGDKSIAVGLIGQVRILASALNGEIKAGDMLTASEIPGVSMKTAKAGQIIGKALEELNLTDESKVVGFYDPDTKEYRSKAGFPNIPIKSNIIRVVKISVLINASWYDPEVYLAQNGDLTISSNDNGYSVSNSKNEALANIEGFLKIIAANIKAGLINASEIVTSSLIVTSDSIIVNGQNLKDYITRVVRESSLHSAMQDFGGQAEIISPVSKIDQLSANIISPLGESLIVRLATPSAQTDSSFIIQNSSGSAVAKIDDQGNARFAGDIEARRASFSGAINSPSLETNNASISGTLRAGNIIADSITGLEAKISNIYGTDFVDLASYSAQFLDVPQLTAERAQFNQGLMVFGSTSLSDLSIVGKLSIGGTMFITENSIEALGADLSFQSLRQGGLSIMSGLVYIDTEGNVKIQGDLSVTGKLAVNIISPYPKSDLLINNASGSSVLSISQFGDIIASGSGTFAKLNFNLVAPVLAVSATEVIASSSAGIANIAPYQSEITIRNALVTDKSVIYITPVGTPSAQTPFLMRQIPQDSFTVGVQSPNKNPIPFNWLIVN